MSGIENRKCKAYFTDDNREPITLWLMGESKHCKDGWLATDHVSTNVYFVFFDREHSPQRWFVVDENYIK